MNVHELRIGNLVHCKKFNTPIILTLGDFGEAYAHADGSDSLEWFKTHIEPLPLDRDWLIDFGFEKEHEMDVNLQKQAGEYILSVTQNLFSGTLEKDPYWWFSIKTGYGSQPVTIEGNYVHELQNLFLSIAKEELKTINR